MDIVRKIERVRTDKTDEPLEECKIHDSGVLPVEEAFDFGTEGEVEGC